jgi:hypothetical protein
MARAAIITGASSGIGNALAKELAARGYDLGLTARREGVLQELKAAIEAAHPGRRVVVQAMDVDDPANVRDGVRSLFAALGDVQVVVANAGIGGPHKVGAGEFDRSRRIIVTNLIGGMATGDAAIECWRERPGPGPRRLVGITSVAGFRGLPTSSAYSASKAGFSTWLEATRAEVKPLGIDVVDIAPGYIDTPINQDMASRPFLIPPDDGARRIADLVERGVYRSAVPTWPWNAIGWVMRRVPDVLWARLGGAAHRSTGR